MKQFVTLPLLLAATAFAPSAQAQDITNSGATIYLTGGAVLYTSGSFNNNSGTLDMSSGNNSLVVGGNLVNASGATLTPGTASTVTLNGAAPQQLSLNGTGLANLTINNTSGGVTLPANSNADVAGALTLTSGMVMTDASSTLRLLNGATLTGEQNGRYVQGNLAAVKANVPAGVATAFANSLTLTPATTTTNLSVTRRAGQNTPQSSYGTYGSNKGIDRIWSTSAPVDGSVQMSWLSDNDNGISDFSQSLAWARTAAPVAGSAWARISNPQNAGGRTATGTVPTGASYSFFTVSTTAAPLPVTLVAFTAERTGDAARLRWTTASELNNDHFDVEMSVDGQAFRKIGQVAGHGTSTTAHDYELSDTRLLTYAADPVYYRLRQVDGDGVDGYSPVRSVRVEGALAFAVAAFPTPHGADGPHLQVRTGLAGALTLTAYDATGRLVFSHLAAVQPGPNVIELPEAGHLASGVYYLKINQANQNTVLKLTRE